MKYIKRFKTHTDYQTYIDSSIALLPNLSTCDDTEHVHYNKEETRLIITYNITNISSSTNIINSNAISLFKEIEIDGVVQPEVVDKYQFETTGNHIIKFELNDPTTIGDNTFTNCGTLTKVIIPKNIKTIGNSAFYYTALSGTLTIPDNVEFIGTYAFSTDPITDLIIGKNCRTIGQYAFSSNTINTITVDENNPYLDSRDNCNAIIETSTNKLIKGCNNTIIPNTVTALGNYSLAGTQISSLIIPNSVVTLDQYCLANNNYLTSLSLPDSVQTIGNSAFYKTKLESINLGSVQTIGSDAFAYCSELTNLVIPNTVTTIGYDAFRSCSKLEHLTIGSGCTSIGGNTFGGLINSCNKLKDITCLATTAPTISNYTFQYSRTGQTLYVPSGATGYDTWMGTGNYYLGKYNWTLQEITE